MCSCAVHLALYIYNINYTVRKFLFSLIALLGLVTFESCKKCFHCHNDCVLCTTTVNNQLFADTLCNDDFNTPQQFADAIANDTAAGFTCNTMPSTYSYEFCVNNPGAEEYPNYFNKGKKVKCDEK